MDNESQGTRKSIFSKEKGESGIIGTMRVRGHKSAFFKVKQ